MKNSGGKVQGPGYNNDRDKVRAIIFFSKTLLLSPGN